MQSLNWGSGSCCVWTLLLELHLKVIRLMKLKKQKAGPNCGGTLRLISLSAAARLRPLFSVSGLSPVKLPAGLTLATLRNSLRRESQLLEFYFLVKWRLEKEIKQIFKNLKKCVLDTVLVHRSIAPETESMQELMVSHHLEHGQSSWGGKGVFIFLELKLLRVTKIHWGLAHQWQ